MWDIEIPWNKFNPTKMNENTFYMITENLSANVDFYAEVMYHILEERREEIDEEIDEECPILTEEEVKNGTITYISSQIYKFLNGLQTRQDAMEWNGLVNMFVNHEYAKRLIRKLIISTPLPEEYQHDTKYIDTFLDNRENRIVKDKPWKVQYNTKLIMNLLEADTSFMERVRMYAENWIHAPNEEYTWENEERDEEDEERNEEDTFYHESFEEYKSDVKIWLALTFNIDPNIIGAISHIHKYQDSIACIAEIDGTQCVIAGDTLWDDLENKKWKEFLVLGYENLKPLEVDWKTVLSRDAIVLSKNLQTNTKLLPFIDGQIIAPPSSLK